MADQNDQQQGGEQTQTAQISGTVQIKPQGGDQQGQGSQQAKGNGPVKPNGQQEEEAPEKKGRRRFIVIGVLIVLALVAGIFYYRSTFTEDTDDAQVDGDLYQVSSRVAGQVIHVYVKDNQVVKAGDPIADIDPKDFEVALEQAQANLANAQAEYEQAKVNVPITSVNVRTSVETSGSDVVGSEASVSQAEADVAAAQARVEQAKANAIKAQLDVDRYTPLVQKDVISKQQFDAAVAQARATTAAVDESQRALHSQQDKVKLAQSRLAQSRSQEQQSRKNGPEQVQVQQARAQAALAAVQQAQARVDQANLNVRYTKIVAPVGGIISKKNVDVGENLSVGQDLLTVVPKTGLWVTANFKETQLKEMHEKQAVELKVDALGGRKFDGHITQIGGATGSRLSLFPPENATGNYVKVVQRIPVRIDFDDLQRQDPNQELRPGMSVTPDVRVKN